jgi:hypothetical protein
MLLRMVFNVVLEALIGAIPVLGDLFDATFKANMRNIRLLNLMAGGGPPDERVNPSLQKRATAAVIGLMVGLVMLVGSVALLWQG